MPAPSTSPSAQLRLSSEPVQCSKRKSAAPWRKQTPRSGPLRGWPFPGRLGAAQQRLATLDGWCRVLVLVRGSFAAQRRWPRWRPPEPTLACAAPAPFSGLRAPRLGLRDARHAVRGLALPAHSKRHRAARLGTGDAKPARPARPASLQPGHASRRLTRCVLLAPWMAARLRRLRLSQTSGRTCLRSASASGWAKADAPRRSSASRPRFRSAQLLARLRCFAGQASFPSCSLASPALHLRRPRATRTSFESTATGTARRASERGLRWSTSTRQQEGNTGPTRGLLESVAACSASRAPSPGRVSIATQQGGCMRSDSAAGAC